MTTTAMFALDNDDESFSTSQYTVPGTVVMVVHVLPDDGQKGSAILDLSVN